jgi:CheY-like chemotaxis protein
MKPVLHILVAEDDADTRDFMEAWLTGIGHRVTLCANGQEAVTVMASAETPIDLVVMDMQMPIMDGMTATRQIRLSPRHGEVPIVCVSAKASGTTEREGLAAGCDIYLMKPCWEDTILGGMTEAMIRRGRLGPHESLE